MEQIACKECTSPDCHGCNMYRLEQMLMSGKLDALMNENRTIKMDADVRPVVLCRDCVHYVEIDGANDEKMCVIDADWCVEDGCYYGFTAYTLPDRFCACGKKREES